MRLSAWLGCCVVVALAGRPAAEAAEGGAAGFLKVAAVQMRSSRNLADNVSRIANSIHECARNGARVVVFPECALSSYVEEVVTNLSVAQLAGAAGQVAEACRQAGAYAVVGTAWREGDRWLDSALILAPTGEVLERYDKIQLAESWPQPGDHLSVFQIDGVPCSVMICHDERYPELVRLPVLAGARVVFYISHESGLRSETKLNPYRAQIQARAVENTVFVVQANAPANPDASGSHGQSRIIAPDGNILHEASIFGEDVVTATLNLRQATRGNARNSLERGPLREWWREGLRRVRMINGLKDRPDRGTPASGATGSNATSSLPQPPTGLLSAGPASPRLYRVYEIALGAAGPGTLPYVNGPGVTAQFTHASGSNYSIRGFWDGANVWRLRFAPTLAGRWDWSTASPDPGLNGAASNFTAVAPTPAELAINPLLRGFLQRDGPAWRLSDGSLFLPVGDTQWSFAEELVLPEFQSWMDALNNRGLNTLHGCAWLAKYNRGGLSPFHGSPGDDRLAPAYFQRLDQMIQYANDRGIMVGLCLGGFPDNSAWWSKFNTQERDDRWFRYLVARYAALNVRWVLYGEVDEANPPWGTWRGEVAHKARLVKAEDPYRHPIGSHHRTVDTASIPDPNVDYLEVQIARGEAQFEAALSYRTWGKPVWFEEYWYESTGYDNEWALGLRNTHRNFVAAMAFPTFGSLMRAHADHPDFPPSRAAALGLDLRSYLQANDPGLSRLQDFVRFFQGLDTGAFVPSAQRVNRGQCGQFGPSLAVFLAGGGAVSLNLSNTAGQFEVRTLEIHTGRTRRMEDLEGGAVRTLETGTTNDVSILISPARPRMEGRNAHDARTEDPWPQR